MTSEAELPLAALAGESGTALSPADPLYDGLTAAAAERLRAHAFARAAAAPSREALAAAREEMRYGMDARTVAAASALLSGAEDADAIAAAAERLRAHDVYFDLDDLRRVPCVTALDVLHEAARRARGGPAACCGGEEPEADGSTPADFAAHLDFVFEDQDGDTLTLADLVAEGPAFLTFFYTRCLAPEKCSATVHRLGRLGSRLGEAPGARAAAIPYDPAYDTPDRIRGYGRARQVAFDARTRLLRPRDGAAALRAAFGLGVGFGPSTVNAHRLEAYVIDRAARVRKAVLRRAWTEAEILRALRAA